MMNKQLIFNPTDADTLLASDSVGAYLRSADGTLLTHTTAGGKQALDVNITNTLNVNLDGDYDASTNPTPDNVGVILHDRNSAPGVAQQNVRSTGAAAASDAVVAANVFGADVNAFGMLFNGTTWDRFKGRNGEALVNDVVNSSFLATAVAVDDTAGGTALPASPLANRKELTVQNVSSQLLYIGGTGVTAAAGAELSAKSSYHVKAGPAAILYAIAPTGKSGAVRVLEAA